MRKCFPGKNTRKLLDLVSDGLVHSLSDIGSGGLAVALARASFANGIGVDAGWHPDGGDENATEFFFSEDAGSILISCASENVDKVTRRIEQDSSHYVAFPIGKTISDDIQIGWEGKIVIKEKISSLMKPWAASLR